MLRNNSMLCLKGKDSRKENFTDLFYDDNYIIQQCKPLDDKNISQLDYKDLHTLLDSIIVDKQINTLLFKSTANQEINFATRTNKSLTHRGKKMPQIMQIETPTQIVRRRERKETIGKVVDEAITQKEEKKENKKMLTKKIMNFYHDVKKEGKKEMNGFRNSERNYRKKRFLEIFEKIKKKVAKGSLALPSVKIDKDNVYSRLFNNVVYLEKQDKGKRSKKANSPNVNLREENLFEAESDSHNNLLKSEMSASNILQPPTLKLCNVIKNSSGKEFAAKITDREYSQCFLRHSGGPRSCTKAVSDADYKNEGGKNFYNIKDQYGNSLLHVSIMEGLCDLAYYLICKGVNPNSQNNVGDTPLHIAVRKEDLKAIQLLLANGASIEYSNHKNEAPIDEAKHEIKKVLLKGISGSEVKRSKQSNPKSLKMLFTLTSTK